MTRLIDADALTNELIKGIEADKDKSIQTSFVKSVCMIICKAIDAQPTIDAIPIEWILNNERMPKEGKGRKAIMDMLEDWRKEHDKAD